MNLQRLFEVQKVLRDRLNYNESDRFNKLILAFLVESGECANEWKGFKFWSKNQEPSRILHTTEGATPENAVFFQCMSQDTCGEYSYKEDYVNLLGEPDYESCPKCREGYTYPFREKTPLLEEYVDKLHFTLEIGLELDITDFEIWSHKEKTITDQYIAIIGAAYASYQMKIKAKEEIPDVVFEYFFGLIVGLGEMLGFTQKQIEQEYLRKNQINHERQENGY